MTAEDDPEKRIRDLERSLSDRVSELGVGSGATGGSVEGDAPQYGYIDAPAPTYIPPRDPYPPPPGAASYSMHPPPPPPGAYGSAYPPPPPPGAYSTPSVTFGTPFERRSPSAFRFGWLLFAIPIVGLVIAGISAAVVFNNTADTVTSQFSSIQSAVPSIGFPAIGTPETAAEGATVSVAGVETRQSVTCEGGTVNVSGVSNTVEVAGHCAEVMVSGVENTVVVDSADVISASGFTNRVTFHSGAPEISAMGDNVIEQG